MRAVAVPIGSNVTGDSLGAAAILQFQRTKYTAAEESSPYDSRWNGKAHSHHPRGSRGHSAHVCFLWRIQRQILLTNLQQKGQEVAATDWEL